MPEVDVLMTTEAFEMSPVHSTLHVVGDGEQALRFLRRTGEFTGAPRPRRTSRPAASCTPTRTSPRPVSLDLFTEAIRQVEDFFLVLAKLPAED